MSSTHIVKEVEIVLTPRVVQMQGMFDVPQRERSVEQWHVDLELPEEWNIGLIVGPSGSGKTTIAQELFGEYIVGDFEWPQNRSVLDAFPEEMSIKDIVGLLSSVGFSSPPSWVRPYHVLSSGEQFRVTIARVLAESYDLAVVDEYTSVVDRTVAQIGSSAIQKTVRRMGKKLIALSCHYDIVDWLEPDWIYEPHLNLTKRVRLRRPEIKLDVRRVSPDAWNIFRKHHYLNTDLNRASRCFVAFKMPEDVPVAFASVLHFPHPRNKRMKREHRTVCLPDYQGVGIGNVLSDFVGSMVTAMGYQYQSQTSHPAMVRNRAKSVNWKMIAAPNVKSKAMPKRPGKGLDEARGDYDVAKRMRATFEYVGPRMNEEQARKLWEGV